MPQRRGGDPRPLGQIAVPAPAGGDIIDAAAAVRPGKAFFWDMQAGSDGQTACELSLSPRGVDNRRLNTLNPGPNGVFESGGVTGPGQLFNGASIATDDVVGSQGVLKANFQAIDPDPNVAADQCLGPIRPRQPRQQPSSDGRNAPTMVGAAFFATTLGRREPNHVFNGL